jgi:hypothetical protein
MLICECDLLTPQKDIPDNLCTPLCSSISSIVLGHAADTLVINHPMLRTMYTVLQKFARKTDGL